MTKGNNTVKCKTPIAILLATYNGDLYLDSQIQSIVNQTNDDWALFIHDDGSKDKTLDVINSWHLRYPERIIVLDYPSQGGACANFMSMLEIIDADYYMFCDQDDVWHQDKVEITYGRMKKIELNNMATIVHTDLRVVNTKLNVIAPSFWKYTNIQPEFYSSFRDCLVNTVTGCTMLFNKQCKVIALSLPYENAVMHDSWITACCYHSKGLVEAIHQQTIDYRQHKNNTLGAKPISKFTFLYRLSHFLSMQKENLKVLRMLNSIEHVNLIDMLMVKFNYRLFIKKQ